MNDIAFGICDDLNMNIIPVLSLLANFLTWFSCLFHKGVFLCDENHWHPLSCKLKTVNFVLPSTNKVEGRQCFQSCMYIRNSVHTAPESMYRPPSLYRFLGPPSPVHEPYPTPSHPRNVQTCSTWISLYSPLTCSLFSKQAFDIRPKCPFVLTITSCHFWCYWFALSNYSTNLHD